MDMAERIVFLRKKQGLSQTDLASMLGVSKSTVCKWEKGNIERMKTSTISKLCGILETDPAYIMGNAEEEKPKEPFIKIPVYGDIPAGLPGGIVNEILDLEEIPRKLAALGEYFGLRVRGQSMEPKISAGDVVIVKRQDSVDDGQIAVVVIEDEEYTLKKIRFRNSMMVLQPLNPSYDPIFFSPEEAEEHRVRIIGRVIELRRKF